jgi:tetratricopeptide (TPR) repeat protein
MELGFVEAEKYMIPIQYQFMRLSTLGAYVEAERVERALALRDSISALLAPPMDRLASIGDVMVQLALNNPAEAAGNLATLQEAIDAMQLHVMDSFIWGGKGRIKKIEGQYRSAVEMYEKQREVDPSNTKVHRDIGECQRKLGEYAKARQSIERRLATHPMDPKAHYEMAMVCAEMGNMSEALEHLRTALDVWEEADPAYEPAKKARGKLKEWQSTTSM